MYSFGQRIEKMKDGGEIGTVMIKCSCSTKNMYVNI